MNKTYWAYTSGSKAGIQHPVKNLAWLIKHAAEVKKIFITPSIALGAHFSADLTNNRTYVTRFESLTIAKQWVKRPCLAHVDINIFENNC